MGLKGFWDSAFGSVAVTYGGRSGVGCWEPRDPWLHVSCIWVDCQNCGPFLGPCL